MRYLSPAEAAKRVGITTDTFHSYRKKGLVPDPDAMIGTVRGWLPETIDAWQKNRPGRGARTDLRDK